MDKDNNIMSGKGEWKENNHPRDEDGKFTSSSSIVSNRKNRQEDATMQKQSIIAKNSTVKPLSQQVDDVLNSTYKDTHITIAEETPQALQDIGVPNKPILMTAKHTYLAINSEGKFKGNEDHYHDLGRELFLKIPKLLKNPVLAFQGKDENDIIVAIDAWDKNKSPIIVPLKINGIGHQNYIEINANVIKSVYGRKNYISYFQKNINNDNLLILDNKKIRSLI